MLLSQLEYFVSVADHRHFGQAAEAAHISASALSESIRKLETHLGVPLIHRSRTFEGLTDDGERVLVWARRILSDHRALVQEVQAARQRLQAHIRFGTIPSGIEAATRILSYLAQEHPEAQTSIETGLTSEDIVTRLRQHTLDAGLIHPSAADSPDLLATPLYEDRAIVVQPIGLTASPPEYLTGRGLAELPLGLLAPRMRAREILDAQLLRHQVVLSPRFEADSVEALMAFVRSGPWSVVLPESTAVAVHGSDDLVAIPLVEPEVLMPIALVRLRDEPLSAVSEGIAKATSCAMRQ